MDFVIVVTRYLTTGTERQGLVLDDRADRAARFPTRDAAEKEAREWDSGRYDLQHDEEDRPTYAVHAVSELPRSLAEQL